MQSPDQYHRYCPGEEGIVISDAVCFGRRRASFPKCPGCQFNDDEKAEPVPARRDRHFPDPEEHRMIEKAFKAYDVRATYPEPLNEDVAWKIGNATAQFFQASLSGMDRIDPNASSLAVGRDMRKSSPALSRAFIDGVRHAGTRVIDVGMIDTSQIYFAVNHLDVTGGVQTTASHNPANYNGFKICGKKGRPISQDTGLLDICRIAQTASKQTVTRIGEVAEQDLTAAYKGFVRQYLNVKRKLRICVDASNGMAGKVFPALFEDVDELEVIPMNFDYEADFVHPPNPLIDANLRDLQAEVSETKCDFGVCFDGDADRSILVDEQARVVRCDMLTALLAPYFLRDKPGATVVYDLRCSRAVPETIKAAGGVPRRERVGHTFMKKALADTKAVFGGELSGHFYFADNWYCDSGMLAFVHTVNILSQSDKPLSGLLAPYQRFAASGERNFKNDKQDETIKALEDVYKDAQIDFLDGITVQYKDWWFNVRKSNTEPLLRLNLEADNQALMEAKFKEVSAYLGTPVAH